MSVCRYLGLAGSAGFILVGEFSLLGSGYPEHPLYWFLWVLVVLTALNFVPVSSKTDARVEGVSRQDR